MRDNKSSVSEVFNKWQIQDSEYVVLAGFDESLIKSSIGYLEQIHVFVITEVLDATSPLLTELGRLFSPFSSILFTESSSYHLPIFKDDGSLWESDEHVYFTASKSADDRSSFAKTPLSIISLSQTSSEPDGTAGISQSSSGTTSSEDSGREENSRKSEKGKEGDKGDKDEADKDNNDPSNDHDLEGPSGDPSQGRNIAGLAEISIDIDSKIHLIQVKQHPGLQVFQTLNMHGSLTIEVFFHCYCTVVVLLPTN